MTHGNIVTDVTPARQKVIDAIEAGASDLESICQATGTISRSTIAYHLRRLAEEGHVVLREHAGRVSIDRELTGYAKGWDAAARLAGNPDA